MRVPACPPLTFYTSAHAALRVFRPYKASSSCAATHPLAPCAILRRSPVWTYNLSAYCRLDRRNLPVLTPSFILGVRIPAPTIPSAHLFAVTLSDRCVLSPPSHVVLSGLISPNVCYSPFSLQIFRLCSPSSFYMWVSLPSPLAASVSKISLSFYPTLMADRPNTSSLA